MKKKKEKDERLPGYPHYPSKEDIMNEKSADRVDADMEEMSRQSSANALKSKTTKQTTPEPTNEVEEGNESDVTAEDLKALGSKNRSNDGGDDEILESIAIDPDFSGDDLDVPGSEDDDEMEEKGSEDEENNYYSRGQE